MNKRILLVDDETPARKELSYLIGRILPTAVIHEANGGVQALQLLQKHEIDAAFIDVNMSDMDGIALAKEIYQSHENIRIVFATAYDLYAVQAFELNAVDYLLKPFEEVRVGQALKKLFKDRPQGPAEDATKAFVAASERKLKKISVWKGDRVILLDLKDIVYLTADERNTLFKTLKGEFLSSQNLGYFEEKLKNESFLRVHRSYIINLEYVMEIQPWFNSTYAVKLMNYEKDEITVSRTHLKQFKDVFEL